MPGKDWTVFAPNHSTYEPLATGSTYEGGLSSNAISVLRVSNFISRSCRIFQITFFFFLLKDCGEFDGIQRILFGSGLEFWLHRLLLLDAMSFLSHGRLSTSLQRYIQVDIDDIFVGQKGTRLVPDDVEVYNC